MTIKHFLVLFGVLGALAGADGKAVVWAVRDQHGLHIVDPEHIGRDLRLIPWEKLEEALPHYTVIPVKTSNGWALHGHVRGPGGGPALAATLASGVHIIGYAGVTVWCIVDRTALTNVPTAMEAITWISAFAYAAGTLAPTP